MATWNGRIQYGSQAGLQVPELMGAMAELAANMTVDLTVSQFPYSLYNALPKAVTTSDRIFWSAVIGNTGANTGDVTAPALSTNFPTDSNTYLPAYNSMSLAVLAFQKKIFDRITINNQELTQVANHADAITSLYETRLKAAVTRILQTVNLALFTGNGSAGITGLATLFSATEHAGLPHTLVNYSGKVEGVDYFLNWRPLDGVYDRSAKTLTLNDAHAAVSATSISFTNDTLGDVFDRWVYEMAIRHRRFGVIVTHPLSMLSMASESRNSGKLNIIVQNGQTLQTELGAATPTYNGLPFIADRLCPLDTFYFLDLNDIQLTTFAYTTGNGANPLATAFADNGLAMAVGPLPHTTVMSEQYEVLTIPYLWVKDTAAVSRLSIVP